jgi:hypothetical protein
MTRASTEPRAVHWSPTHLNRIALGQHHEATTTERARTLIVALDARGARPVVKPILWPAVLAYY